MFSFWREADPVARRTLIAASLGWMLDAFDVWIYALVLTSVKADLSLSAATAGGLQGLTLLASALGGIAFGLVADRWGRVRALMVSVLLYSVFTAACGLAQTALQLALFRVGLGIGMGGEWASGAALVSETWKPEHRNRAMAFMQSAWAVGLGLAALVNWLVQDVAHLNWRAVFLVGIAPALFAWWVRRRVPEPAAWHASRARGARRRHGHHRDGPVLRRPPDDQVDGRSGAVRAPCQDQGGEASRSLPDVHPGPDGPERAGRGRYRRLSAQSLRKG